MMQSKFYPITPTDMRRQDRFIILAHVSNFPLRSHFFNPDLRNKTNYYCFNEVKDYFRERVDIRQLPFHYYTSLIRNDWELFTGAPMHYRSPIIGKAAESYYIEDRFRDAIIVCVQDNFSLNTADPRMLEMLGANLIAPLMKNFRVNFRDSVFWFDEIFNWDKYEQDLRDRPLDIKYPYEVNRMKYFDRTIFNLETIRFL
jgi:hypothetical protein